MRYRFLFICLTFYLLDASAQSPQVLSNSAQISLWSVVPGDQLYSIFGHSALQVQDGPVNKVYNYGTFDFDTPNFYLKFMRGQLPYYLNIETFNAFAYGNRLEGRSMTQQVLNLDSTERQRLFTLLETNAKEENKHYKYEFFYDNCATRIRDIMQESVFHTLNWDSAHVRPGVTMRTLLHEHLTTQPWSEFGIDLVLGTPCDKRPTAEDYMFLPIYLHDVVAKTQKKDGKPLVAMEERYPAPPRPKLSDHPLTQPIWVMSLIALIGLLSMLHPTMRKVFDWFFWSAVSVVGLIIVFLWFFTEHNATKMNLNLVWAMPLHLLFFARRRTSEWAENYFMGIGMACLCMLLLWKWLPQQLPVAVIPILILIVVKCFFVRHERKSWEHKAVATS